MLSVITLIFQIALIGVFIILSFQTLTKIIKFFNNLDNGRYWACQDFNNNLNILDQQLNLFKQDFVYQFKDIDKKIKDLTIDIENLKETTNQIENFLDKDDSISFHKRNKKYRTNDFSDRD